MHKWAALLLLVALTACDPPPQPDEDDSAMDAPDLMPQTGETVWPDTPDAEPEPEGEPVSSITGEWRVAGVDGKDVDLDHAITLSIDGEQIRVASGCVLMGWRYTLKQGQLKTQSEAPMSCLRPLNDIESRLGSAFDSGAQVYRLPSNGVVIAGAEHKATLFTQ